jgi:hypothetical protein
MRSRRRFDRESDLAAIAAELSVRLCCDGPVEIVGCSGENTNPNVLGYSDRSTRPGDMIFVDLRSTGPNLGNIPGREPASRM